MKELDIADIIISYEQGELNDTETIEFFQELLDTGLIYGLQGSYLRTAKYLLEEELIFKKSV